MSGAVKSNVFGSSGTVAAAAGGLSWQSVVTASTVTVESNKGYFVNTTSNACTVTLPASPDVGDQVILLDYARTWDTNAITIDSNGNNFQGQADTYTVDYDTEGQGINIVYSGSTNGWIPNSDIANALTPAVPQTQKAIFGFGNTGTRTGVSNLVNSSGVVAADVSAVGTARSNLAATTYGGDKAIFAFGVTQDDSIVNTRNLVNNSGVIASDATGAGTVKTNLAGVKYGLSGLALFAFGAVSGGAGQNARNLVNSSGVVASDASGAGTARNALAATTYGVGLGIFRGGADTYGMSNLVNTSGVVSADVSAVGTGRAASAGASYGTDKGIFAYGWNDSSNYNMSNLVSNTGVVAADVSGVGTARRFLAGSGYGGDKGLFGYGYTSSAVSIKNLVSNTGVVATDVSGVGTARYAIAAAGYSYSA